MRAAVDLCGNDQRAIAVLVVIAVELRKLLLPVGLIIGSVEVENDLLRLGVGILRNEDLQERIGHRPKLLSAYRVLKPRQRGLRSQSPFRPRQTPNA